MAEIIDTDMTPAANVQLQKRSFAADITNQNTTTSSRKKSKPESPPDEFVGGWSAADLSSSEPHSDATEEGTMARQTYGFPLVVQKRHSSEIASSVEFYVHKAPNAVEAAKARQSGVPLLTFVPTREQPLEQMPTGGGVCHVKNASKISPDVVGVNEEKAAAAALGNKVKARKKQGNGQKKGARLGVAGETRCCPFQVWRGDKESREASPWYTVAKDAATDCKRRWPNVAKTHPDYETTKMTRVLILALQGTSPRSLTKGRDGARALEKTVETTKWNFAWKEPGA